ncbi:T9SS type A sorting domain-containing protein, partial [Hydrotalea sp.]|uniref:T9SS type A sorting domain-containing protein n=1 Tax=Hydrotalea sp. TaxID=2881279 RepID=UPI003D0EFE53
GPSVAGSAANQYIQPGQSIFLQNDFTTNTRQFIVTEANKNTNPANLTGVFSQAAPMTKLYLTLLNAQGQTRDGALLAQRSDFHNSSIIGEDAHKFRNPTENMAFHAQAQNWSIQKIQQLALGDTLPVALWNLHLHEPYTFVAAGDQIPAGWAIYDAYTQKLYPVNNGDTLRLSFTPTTDTATYLHRFSVVRTQALTNASAIGLQVQAMNGGYHLLGTAPDNLAATGPDYTFERSTDSLHFMPVGQVANVHDTAFGYVDIPTPAGTLWYRIRALAADRTLYSNIVRVTALGKDRQIRIYPNPSDGQSIALSTENLPTGLYYIQLYNNNGQRVYANQISIGNGSSAQALQWNTRLAAGTYYLQLSSVQNPAVQFTQTLIIQNH